MCKPPYKLVLPSSDSLFQTIFRDIYPRFPSRRNIGNDRQLTDLMEISSLYGSHRAAPIA